MNHDEELAELNHLERLGCQVPNDPDERLLLTARMLTPSAWSEWSQEHIDWCSHHGIRSGTYFGVQFTQSRRLSILKAARLLRMLDRQAEGRPDLEIMNARAMSERLEKRLKDLPLSWPQRYPPHEAVDAVFLMHPMDGIIAPDATLNDDGTIDLRWHEDGREVLLHVGTDKTYTLNASEGLDFPRPIEISIWKPEGMRLLARLVDWVHFAEENPLLKEPEPA